MIMPAVPAGAASVVLVFMAAWYRRPRAFARSTSTRSRSKRTVRRWSWIVLACVTAVISPVLGFVALTAPPVARQWSRVRHRAHIARRIAHDFPDALDLLVLSIRAGYLPAQAVVEVVPFLPHPLRLSFVAVGEAMQRGERFADALTQLRTQLGPIAQPLVDSLSAADRYGLPLAPVLERLSLEARQQRRREADATARELPVRLAMPLVICTLPSFVLLAIVPLLLGALSSLRT
jgi:tight adherence protein C